MGYFSGYDTPEAIKARYKELAKRLHPDAGGDTHAFAELGRQYAQALQMAGRRAQRAGDLTEMAEYASILADFLHKANPSLGETVRRAADSPMGAVVMSALPDEYKNLAATIMQKL